MVPRRTQVGSPTCGPTQARTTNPSKSGPRGGTSGAVACDPCAKPGTSGPSGERSGGRRRHSGPRDTLTDTHKHTDTNARTGQVGPSSTNYKSQQAVGEGAGPRGGWCSRPEASVWRGGMISAGCGPPCRGEESPSLPAAWLFAPAHTAPPWGRRPEPFSAIQSPALPTRLGLPGKGMAGGRLGQPPWRDAESASLTLSSIAWSELPFPGARSSPDLEAGLSLLGSLCGLQVSWRSPGKARVLRVLGYKSGCSVHGV